MDWTFEQLAVVLARSKHEPRRNLKRYLKDLGGRGSAEELDEALEQAMSDSKVVAESERISAVRSSESRSINEEVDVQLTIMFEQALAKMEERGLSIGELAVLCGWSGSLTSELMNRQKTPTAEQLAKVASALKCNWRLTDED